MIKKSIPLIVTIFIFTAFLLYATYDRTRKANDSALGNKSTNYSQEDVSIKSTQTSNKVNSIIKNKNLYNNDTPVVNQQNIKDETKKSDINTVNYLSSLQCVSYKLKSGETLTDVARKYQETCNLNTTIKIIKSINKINDENNINAQSVLYIPEYALKNGRIHKVSAGDTWYKIANDYYPKYTTDSIMKFLVYINNLSNNDLPLGEEIFIPSI